MNTLSGRRAVITGASRGFGFAVAQAFLAAGAALVISARSANDLEEARERLASSRTDAEIEVCAGDVSDPGDVARLASIAAHRGGADIVVCNAGVYGPKGEIATTDFTEWMDAIAVNLGGVVLCAQAFAQQLRARDHGKCIVLSGGGATKPMPNLSSYAASKAAVVRFAETLAMEWKADGVDVNAVAPGALNTRLLDEIIDAGPEAVGRDFYEASLKQKSSGGSPLQRGADLCVFLASAASDGITGKLISAIWDPWERFPELREQLGASDVYTLRRIVAEERGLAW